MPAARVYTVAGKRLSLRLEDEFVSALVDVAAHEGVSLGAIIARAAKRRPELGRTSATRAHLLCFYRDSLDALDPRRRVPGAFAPLAAPAVSPAAGATA